MVSVPPSMIKQKLGEHIAEQAKPERNRVLRGVFHVLRSQAYATTGIQQ